VNFNRCLGDGQRMMLLWRSKIALMRWNPYLNKCKHSEMPCCPSPRQVVQRVQIREFDEARINAVVFFKPHPREVMCLRNVAYPVTFLRHITSRGCGLKKTTALILASSNSLICTLDEARINAVVFFKPHPREVMCLRNVTG
jgi:hypothetical protein